MPRALPLILGLTIAAVVFLVVPAIVRRIGTFNRLVIGIALLSPLAATGVEVARGKMHPSARNVLVGYGLYAFRVCYLLGVQFALLPLMFLVGPVWLLAIFITLADVVVRFLPSVQNLPLPPLCGFVHIGPLDCVPALVACGRSQASLSSQCRYWSMVTSVASMQKGLTATSCGRASDWISGSQENSRLPAAFTSPRSQGSRLVTSAAPI